MNERIKELAEQANAYADWSLDTDPRVNWYEVRDAHFAELVRADEREKCAKLCEDINKTFGVGFIAVDNCAAAIRGRTE